ncbi:restriction endonuclease subunit S [Streptomyces sp. NPDC093228]|uniref:restriction endonuclease subunit S n=1 Tax=Streptomyces sp. NPDC093228 TaxID=3155070 RepID=UPI003416E8C4
MNDLAPYPAYTTPAVLGLGDIPSHWEERRAKFYLREVDERSPSGTEEQLSVSHLTGVRPRRHKNVTMVAASYVGHKVCQPGDVVVNTMWAWMAALGVSPRAGLVSPSYGVYRPRSPHTFVPAYLDRLLRLPAYADEYRVNSTGVTSSRLRLYPDRFLNISLIHPPFDEQRVIVGYLRRIEQQVGSAVRAKQELISLMREQRRTVVGDAVRRGIGSSADLVESGIPWVGAIPRTWEISRVKAEFICEDRKRIPLSGEERGRQTDRRYDYYGASGVIDQVNDYIFEGERLLIAEDGANLVLRNLPLAIIASGKYWVNNHAHVLRPRSGNITYLSWLLESIDYRPWITGAAQPKLTQDRLMSIKIAVPPVVEQDKIVQRIRALLTPIDNAIERIRREIDLLREYQTRMTADVITGKLDVRAAAAALSDADLHDPDLTAVFDADEDGLNADLNGDDLPEELM